MATIIAQLGYKPLKGTDLFPLRIRVSVGSQTPRYEGVSVPLSGAAPQKVYLKKTQFKNGRVLTYHVHHQAINQAMKNRMDELEAICQEWDRQNRGYTPEEVLAEDYATFLTRKTAVGQQEAERTVLGSSRAFLVRARALAKIRHQVDERQGRNYDSHISIWEGFLETIGRSDLDLDELTDEQIQQFFSYCRNKTTKPNLDSTLATKLKFIRLVLNDAVRRKVISGSPLGPVRGLKPHSRKKQVLTQEEINQLEEIDFTLYRSRSTHLLQEAVDVFILQFYLRGSRVGDVLRIDSSRIRRDEKGVITRLIFQQTKGERHMDMAVPLEARRILNRYSRTGPGYWLPFLKFVYDPLRTAEENKSDLKYAIDKCNGVLNKNIRKACEIAKIQKHVTTHVARHSFARHARKRKKKDLDMIKDWMGHSSIEMTMIYTGEHDTDEQDADAKDLF